MYKTISEGIFIGLFALTWMTCTSSPKMALDGASLKTSSKYADTGSLLDARPDIPSEAPAFYLQVDPTLPSWVSGRFKTLLSSATSLPVRELAPLGEPFSVSRGSVILSLGRTATAGRLIPSDDPQFLSLPPDGFILRSAIQNGVQLIVAVGKTVSKQDSVDVNRGALYGAYTALEALGFAFLHPLAPYAPEKLTLPKASLDLCQSPHWPRRGIHLHTMHPIELTELLNGWGPKGPDDEKGFTEELQLWQRYCEWLLANRQNLVEWVLLEAPGWKDFSQSKLRQERMKRLVEIAHQYGISVGLDVGIVLEQQHNFRLIRETGDIADEKKQLRENVDWLMSAGFDFISTEIGSSEFTSPDDERMLAWINELGLFLKQRYHKKAYIKVHCTQGQSAPHFKDPKTGEALNYNFLPHYAVPEVGVFPHTVQFYALDDPAPTYNNSDFAFMREFIRQEAGGREVLWYPETAYWVSFDIDVPLFLPVYALGRLRDLRLIGSDEAAGLVGQGIHAGSRIQGQMIFSSGWEWGYWLNDVIAARAAFDPHLESKSDAEAFKRMLGPLLQPLAPAAEELADLLVRIAEDQRALLIQGQVAGIKPDNIQRLNGQAYMQGWESFDDVNTLVSKLPNLPAMQTQPDKLGLVDMRNPLKKGAPYKKVRPLLSAMASSFAFHLKQAEALAQKVPQKSRPLLQELIDGIQINALRSKQLLGLYEYVDGLNVLGQPSEEAKKHLASARLALDEARQVIALREKNYRMPVERIAAWRDNPTVYRFTYLWTVHTLHYWWRDEGKAVKAPNSPCYLNLVDPAVVAFGEGFWVDAAPMIQKALQLGGLGALIGECMTSPVEAPIYPPAGVRSGP